MTTNLEFRNLRRGPGDDRYVWKPFEPNAQFDRDDWWDDLPSRWDNPWFVQVLLDGTEEARVELDETFYGSAHDGAPELGPEVLVVRQIEVGRSHRRLGIGSKVVAGLAAAIPGRRLIALGMDADEFWASLGWDRFDDSSHGPHH
jgi:hypothetical protein